MRSKLVFVGIWVAFLLGGSSPGTSFASSGGSAQETSLTQDVARQIPWNSDQYQECGQTCTLDKANQNISMQALYLVQRITDLRDQYQQKNYARVKSELSGYCPDLNTSNHQDDARQCLERYISLQSAALRAMRGELIKNQQAVASYASQAPSVRRPGGPSPKQVQAMSVSTGDELDQQRVIEDVNNRLQFLASERYQKWVDQELPHCPSKEDFTTLDTGGNPVFNSSGYASASAKCQADRATFKKSFAQTQPPSPTPVSSMAAASYRTARNRYVGYSNAASQSMRTGVAVVSYGDPRNASQNRAIAGVAPPSDPTRDAAIVPAPGPTQTHAILSPDYITMMLGRFRDLKLDDQSTYYKLDP